MKVNNYKWYVGAKLHVIVRGNHRNDIFRGRIDYEVYLNYLKEAMEYMDKRQGGMYMMQRGLEENVKVTRAEQEKMIYVLADIQGKVTKLTEEVDEHEAVIKQIRSIK